MLKDWRGGEDDGNSDTDSDDLSSCQREYRGITNNCDGPLQNPAISATNYARQRMQIARDENGSTNLEAPVRPSAQVSTLEPCLVFPFSERDDVVFGSRSLIFS